MCEPDISFDRLNSVYALEGILVLPLQHHSVSFRKHNWETGTTGKTQRCAARSAFGISEKPIRRAIGGSRWARIGRNYNARPLRLTMVSGKKPALDFRPTTSVRPPLRLESVYVPSVLSRSTGLRPADSRRPSLSIQPAAATSCLPVWVLSQGGCRFPRANFRAGSRVVPTALLYKCLGLL